MQDHTPGHVAHPPPCHALQSAQLCTRHHAWPRIPHAAPLHTPHHRQRHRHHVNLPTPRKPTSSPARPAKAISSCSRR
eukprot:1157587-Pelagomonas_calceolata.AAC.11